MSHQKGLLLATLVGLGCGLLARPLLAPTAAQAQARANQSAPLGRYQISNSEGTLFFLDTATGRLWRTAAAYIPGKQPWSAVNSPVADAK